MKQQIVNIPREEMRQVEKLYYLYNIKYNNLQKLAKNNVKISLDKQLHDLAKCYINLENLKIELGEKYRPKGPWVKFSFDFDTNSVIYFIYGGTDV